MLEDKYDKVKEIVSKDLIYKSYKPMGFIPYRSSSLSRIYRRYAKKRNEKLSATFGMTPSEYKEFKGLEKQRDHLRDHMTDLELIFTMLGEASTTEIARNKDAQGYDENLDAAGEGGAVAGSARKDLERKSGKRVSTRENFKEIPEAKKRKIGFKGDDE